MYWNVIQKSKAMNQVLISGSSPVKKVINKSSMNVTDVVDSAPRRASMIAVMMKELSPVVVLKKKTKLDILKAEF